jgi:glycosyltransferase involved in cell wall biosynthesis
VLVTGRATPQLRADLGLASRLGLARWVQTLDEVAAQDLPALYRLAAAVPVLSHSEGFSFPTLEALASGTPVLVSRASAQAELAGEAGLAVDPASPGEVGTALERARRERAHLRRLGLERARAFTWERTAERVEAVWQALA